MRDSFTHRDFKVFLRRGGTRAEFFKELESKHFNIVTFRMVFEKKSGWLASWVMSTSNISRLREVLDPEVVPPDSTTASFLNEWTAQRLVSDEALSLSFWGISDGLNWKLATRSPFESVQLKAIEDGMTLSVSGNEALTYRAAVALTFKEPTCFTRNLHKHLSLEMSHEFFKNNPYLLGRFQDAVSEVDPHTFEVLGRSWCGSLKELLEACVEI